MKNLRRSALLPIIILLGTLMAGQGRAAGDAAAPAVSSRSALVVDEETGRVLFFKDADTPRPIASTTKIMTALLVLERTAPGDEVTVGAGAAAADGATIGLKAGERRRVSDLLNALMLASANDAAAALAEHIGGSEAGFANMMNERAKQLGAVNTNFINPHGLAPGRLHYSTAAELAKIAREAMKKPEFRRLVATRRYSWETTSSAKPLLLTNSNHLLERYPLATGIKTGHTNESGYCLVASAAKGRRTAIAVVLGGATRETSFVDARRLMDWALNSFELRPVVKKNRRYGTLMRAGRSVPLLANKSVVDLVYSDAEGGPTLRLMIERGIKLPIRKGQKLGKLVIVQMGKRVGTVGLVAGRSVSAPYINDDIGDYFRRVVKKLKNLL